MATLIPALGACVSRMGTAQRAGKPTWEIIPDGSPQSVPNPLEQTRRPTGACRRHSAAHTYQLPPRWRGDPGADLLNATRQDGHAWGDMAAIFRRHDEMDECAQALSRWQLPHQVRERSGSFNPNDDTITVLTMHISKVLEFPVVALMGVGQMPAKGEEARLFYVTATRATHRLVITASGDGGFCRRLEV